MDSDLRKSFPYPGIVFRSHICLDNHDCNGHYTWSERLEQDEDSWAGIFLLHLPAYDLEECIANGLVRQSEGAPYLPRLILFKEVFETDLTFRSDFKYEITPFMESCNLTLDLIKMTMLSYLFNTSIRQRKSIFEHFGCEVTRLAWIHYHEIENKALIHSSCGHTCSSKEKSKYLCVICKAEENIQVHSNGFRSTTSPAVMSSNRVGHQAPHVDGINYHYVVWTAKHSGMIDPDVITGLVNSLGKGLFYIHGEMQYGHNHVHVVKGSFYKTRTFDIMRHCQNAVNSNIRIEKSDFFHPIVTWFSNLDEESVDAFITAILIMRFRIRYFLDFNTLPQFYKLTYPEACGAVRRYFENLVFGYICY